MRLALEMVRIAALRVIVISVIVTAISSCSSFYMAERVPLEPREAVYELIEDSAKYVILHFTNMDFHLTEVKVEREQGIITGKAVALPSEHMAWREKQKEQGIPYKPNEYSPLNEVHITIPEHHSRIDTLPRIRISQIQSVHENKVDKASTKTAKQGRVAGSMAIVMAVVLISLLLASTIAWEP